MIAWLLSLAALAAFVLIGGGLYLWRRDRRRALLMLGAATVTLLNLYLWSTMPRPPAG